MENTRDKLQSDVNKRLELNRLVEEAKITRDELNKFKTSFRDNKERQNKGPSEEI